MWFSAAWTRFLWFGLLLTLAIPSQAQQVLCERYFASLPYWYHVTTFSPRPDSVLVLSKKYANSSVPATFRLRRITAGCDTAQFALPPNTSYDRPNYPHAALCTNQKGNLIVATAQLGGNWIPFANDSLRVSIQCLTPNGTLRWRRTLPPAQGVERPSAILLAPDGGFYLTINTGEVTLTPAYLVKLDSLGRLQWRRQYRAQLGVYVFSGMRYTATGNLLLLDATLNSSFRLLEVNQQGDSLTSRAITIHPDYWPRFDQICGQSFVALRDGGFLIVGKCDSTVSTNRAVIRPFALKVNRQLQVVWSSLSRRPVPPNDGWYAYSAAHELADGSLVVLENSTQTRYNAPFWLNHFSASGTLLNRYAFTPASPAVTNWVGQGVALEPVPADSSFVAVFEWSYLARIKAPNLRRVVTTTNFPPLITAARTAAAAAWPAPAYPNPATGSVQVPYALPAAAQSAALELRDVAGRVVRRVPLPAARAGTATVPLHGVPPGLYLCVLLAQGQAPLTQKLLVAP